MAFPDFLEHVRVGANLVFPEVWLDPDQEPVNDIAWAESLANMWLTPALVNGFTDDDFAFLPADRRAELRQAVETMRRVVSAVPPGGEPTQEQVAEALPAFTTVVRIARPFLMAGPEAAAIQRAIWLACKDDRDWSPGVDFELTSDWTGDPSIQIWLILNDDVDVEAPAVREKLTRVRDAIRQRLAEAGVGRWPYIGVRSRSEVKELLAKVPA